MGRRPYDLLPGEMPEVSRITYQFSEKPQHETTMPLLRVSVCTSKKEGEGMSTLHILINPHTEHIVNAVHDDQLQGDSVKKFVKHHQEQEGRALARVIVKKGMPVKVIQAGEEA